MKESRIKALLKRPKDDVSEVLFHHRFATSTVDVRNACHPFSTKDNFEYQYIGVHNGVIRNSRDLRTEHEKLGINYVSVQENDTFNDSEALVYDLARYFEGQVDSLTAAGSIAFIVVKRDMQGKPLNLFFGHNAGGSTLVMKKTEHSLTISSTGEGDHVPINTLHIFDYDTKEVRTAPMYLPSSYYSGNLGNPTYNSSTRSYDHTNVSTNNPKAHTPWSNFRTDDSRFSTPVSDAIPDPKPLDEEDIDELTNKVKERLENMYEMRTGSKEDIKMEFLSDNFGHYEGAAIAAMIEVTKARQEQDLMDKCIAHEENPDNQVDIVTYWTEVKLYGDKLEDIADELHREAKLKAGEKKEEDKGKQPLGFHSTRVINKTPERLLPSNVLRNNNKQLN